MLKEAVGGVRGPVAGLPCGFPGRLLIGIWIRSASWWFPPGMDLAEWAEGVPMPVEDRAGKADGTGSRILDEATLRALIEHVPVTVYIDRLD